MKYRALLSALLLVVLAFNIVPPILIFILLLLYDPYLTGLSRGNLPFIISIGIILAGVISGICICVRSVNYHNANALCRNGKVWVSRFWDGRSRSMKLVSVAIRNRGTGYGIIKKIEILLDGHAVADAKTALEAVLGPNDHLIWKSLPLVGQKDSARREFNGHIHQRS